MKIKSGNKLYVQKNDLVHLNRFYNGVIPASIFHKIFGYGRVIIDDTNRYDFIEFKDSSEIAFFEPFTWIVDYNKIKDYTEDEIVLLGQTYAEKKNEIARKFNKMTDEEKQANMDLYRTAEILDHKMYSLRDIVWQRQGYLSFRLPSITRDVEENKSQPQKTGGFSPINRLFKTFKKEQ